MCIALYERSLRINEVSLIFDEMYVYETLEYSCGKFFGMARNKNEAATTILTFMIKSMAGKYCDVISMCPLNGFNITILGDFFKKAMSLVLDAGFDCICAISDNHPINRAYFKHLGNNELQHCVANPCNAEKPLFLLIDPTHNFKNIFNNFQKRDVLETPSTDDFPAYCAHFSHVKQLFDAERTSGLRLAHKLNERVLNPSNVNRTSVKLASAVFHESTMNALQYFASIHEDKKEWSETSK